MQFLGEGNQVDGLLAFSERDHLGKDATVLVEKKVFGLESFDSGVQRVIIEEDGAEDGTLGVEIVRERFFESGFWHRRSLGYFAFSSL